MYNGWGVYKIRDAGVFKLGPNAFIGWLSGWNNPIVGCRKQRNFRSWSDFYFDHSKNWAVQISCW